jgi:hypothetical protein
MCLGEGGEYKKKILADWKKEGYEIPKGKLSIHSAESIKFTEQVLKAGSWQMKVLKEGYKPQFSAQPPRYREKNNRSAERELDIVREKVKEWEEDGFVTRLNEPAWCTNPLSVVTKVEAETGKVKKRVVLDTSRHLKRFAVKQTVHLEDLAATAAMVERNDFSCIFDLENQFFHVQLDPAARKYFGFALKNEKGEENYYCFNIMVYGFAPAVAVVTRLIKPLQGLLHEAGIRTSIYVDDGQVLGSSENEARQDMEVTVTAFQLAGWNIQWKKTNVEPAKNLKYLGFIVDTERMEYRASPEKQEAIIASAARIAEQARTDRVVGARDLSKLLGKLAALRVSHGRALHIATRQVQNKMGRAVNEKGWETMVELGAGEQGELEWIRHNLTAFNGRGIRVETGEEINKQGTGQVTGEGDDTTDLPGQDRQESWEVWEDNRLERQDDFPGGGNRVAILAAMQEMRQLRDVLMELDDRGDSEDWRRLVWTTNSRNFYNFVNKGARWPQIRSLSLQIKYRERQTKTEVKLVWVSDSPIETAIVDDRSRLSTSTDEWGLDRKEIAALCQSFRIRPTTDCFASSSSAVCEHFFSKVPQRGCSAVDFFAQQLQPGQVYYCCPPVKEVGHMLRRLFRFPEVTALVVIPAWTGSPYWGMIRQHGGFVKAVLKWQVWQPVCQDYGLGRSLFTSGTNIQMWAGVIYTGTVR